MTRKTVGIEIRHDRNCPARQGKHCACSPGYRAEAHSAADERRVRKTFRTLAWPAGSMMCGPRQSRSTVSDAAIRELFANSRSSADDLPG
jgi:hypothetical protein